MPTKMCRFYPDEKSSKLEFLENVAYQFMIMNDWLLSRRWTFYIPYVLRHSTLIQGTVLKVVTVVITSMCIYAAIYIYMHRSEKFTCVNDY